MQADAALPLVLMTLGAVAMPTVARRAGIPVSVAEIAYGVLIGVSGLNLAGDPNNLFIRFLAELGFAFFLFLAGLEIDFQGIERRGVRSLALPTLMACLAFALSLGACAALGWSPWVGLAAGATSVPLLLAVVRELRLGATTLGSTLITAAAVGELVTIALLTVLDIRYHARSWRDALAAVGRLAGLCAAVGAATVVLRALLWWYPAPFTRLVRRDDPAELGVRAGFGLMFAFVGLSLLAGVEPFLGAFIAGALLGFLVRQAGVLEHKLASIGYGFFVPVFFIHVGMRLRISADLLLDSWRMIAIIIGIMFAAKLLAGLLLLLRGLRLREVLAASALLSAPLTLVIAVVDLGARAGAIDESTAAVVVTAGILASLLYPSLARALLGGGAGEGRARRVG